jgi:hypothetical protein
MANKDILHKIAFSDVVQLMQKDKEYRGSWKKRGGIGAFMMLARKWDRIEAQTEEKGYDIFLALQEMKKEGLLDDIGDLRRYLLLVEMEMQIRTATEHEMMAVAGEAYIVHTKKCSGCGECTGEFIREDDVTQGYIYKARS